MGKEISVESICRCFLNELFIVIITSWWTEIILLDASPFRIHFHLQLIISAKVNLKGKFCCYGLNFLFNNIDKSYWCRTLGKNYAYNRLPNHFYYNARSITRELQKGFIYHNRKRIFVGARCFLQLKRIRWWFSLLLLVPNTYSFIFSQ